MRTPVGNCLSPGPKHIRNIQFLFHFIIILLCCAFYAGSNFSSCLFNMPSCCYPVVVAFSLLFLISFLHLCYVALWVAPPFSVLGSVLFPFPVVIRWHITLKCLLLFYKINFFRYLARPTCLSAKKESPTKSHKNNNVMPISFTATFINQEEGAEAAAACGMFYLPSESFRVEVLVRCV